MSGRTFLIALLAASAAGAAPAAPAYKAAGSVSLGSPDRWDYTVFDPPSGRVYVAHGENVTVVDGRAGRIIGQIEGIAGGTHGTALLPGQRKGFTDDGRNGVAVVFDAKSLKVTGRIPADDDADAMVADRASGHIFVIEGDPGAITVIDPVVEKAVATITVGEKLEYGVSDEAGALYVAGEAAGDVVRIDTRSNRVTARWAAADCKSPHGLALDRKAHRLFMGCVNSEMVVLDALTGRVVAKLPIGLGSDAVAFDPVRRRVFSSNGVDGTITAYQQLSADRYRALEPIRTKVSGRTMTVDPGSGRLFVAAADTDPSPTPGGRAKPRPGTLRLMMFDPIS